MLQIRWNKRFAYYLLLTFAVVIGLQLRLKPLRHLEGQYLVGSDAYRLLRQSQQIVKDGHLPERDFMRHAPLGKESTFQLVAFALFLPTGGFLLILARFLTSQKDIRLSKWIISEKWIRYGFFICLTSVGVLVAFSFNGLSLLFQILDTVHERLFFPFGDDRIMRNVAELHPMYFINWWDRFGIFLFPSLAGVSLLFSQLLGQLGLSSRLVMPAFGGFMVTTFLSTLSPVPHGSMAEEQLPNNSF